MKRIAPCPLRWLTITSQIGQAYQVLSDKDLRKQYDKLGKDKVQSDNSKFLSAYALVRLQLNDSTEDPFELFSLIFGGQAFEDWYGTFVPSTLRC